MFDQTDNLPSSKSTNEDCDGGDAKSQETKKKGCQLEPPSFLTALTTFNKDQTSALASLKQELAAKKQPLKDVPKMLEATKRNLQEAIRMKEKICAQRQEIHDFKLAESQKFLGTVNLK